MLYEFELSYNSAETTKIIFERKVKIVQLITVQ